MTISVQRSSSPVPMVGGDWHWVSVVDRREREVHVSYDLFSSDGRVIASCASFEAMKAAARLLEPGSFKISVAFSSRAKAVG
jgi:hypothetical protein